MLQVPNHLSISGAVLICSCTFLLGVFTRKKEPAATQTTGPQESGTTNAEVDPAVAERQELESLLGHSPRQVTQNGRDENV